MWDLGPSPNSKKVRLALGYKGLDYERISVDPKERGEIVSVSGQPLTPVLKHGETVMFDSNAILRYVDANVKREPRLYAEDYDAMQRIESWESWTRMNLGPPVGMLFGQYFAESRDETVIAHANQLLGKACVEIEAELGDREVLVGDAITAADIQPASFLGMAYLSPELASSHPILEFFKTHLQVGPQHETITAWFRRVNAFDK
jgi:glutathione S-transferase